MTIKQNIYRLGNGLFKYGYPIYFPLYSAWKAFSDRRERALVHRLVAPGAVIVDVGANIGIYSRFFSRLTGQAGRVHAFEPAPVNFAHLRDTARGHPNIALNHAAVGDRSGTVRLYLSSDLNVDHRTFDSGDGRVGVEVPLLSLDGYFPPGQRVDFIKIDVQGFEMAVLEGASRVLTENRDIAVLIEFWPYGLGKAGTDPRAIIAFAEAHGFSLVPVGEAGPSLKSLLSGPAGVDDYCNVIMTRRGI